MQLPDWLDLSPSVLLQSCGCDSSGRFRAFLRFLRSQVELCTIAAFIHRVVRTTALVLKRTSRPCAHCAHAIIFRSRLHGPERKGQSRFHCKKTHSKSRNFARRRLRSPRKEAFLCDFVAIRKCIFDSCRQLFFSVILLESRSHSCLFVGSRTDVDLRRLACLAQNECIDCPLVDFTDERRLFWKCFKKGNVCRRVRRECLQKSFTKGQ